MSLNLTNGLKDIKKTNLNGNLHLQSIVVQIKLNDVS